jgi:hypothetical protein
LVAGVDRIVKPPFAHCDTISQDVELDTKLTVLGMFAFEE